MFSFHDLQSVLCPNLDAVKDVANQAAFDEAVDVCLHCRPEDFLSDNLLHRCCTTVNVQTKVCSQTDTQLHGRVFRRDLDLTRLVHPHIKLVQFFEVCERLSIWWVTRLQRGNGGNGKQLCSLLSDDQDSWWWHTSRKRDREWIGGPSWVLVGSSVRHPWYVLDGVVELTQPHGPTLGCADHVSGDIRVEPARWHHTQFVLLIGEPKEFVKYSQDVCQTDHTFNHRVAFSFQSSPSDGLPVESTRYELDWAFFAILR